MKSEFESQKLWQYLLRY